MLNERTQAKIGIINTDRAKIAEALLECIAPENLPRQYGGTCTLELGESEEERKMRAYVASITPSLAPTTDTDGGEEVEVDLRHDMAPNIPRSKDGDPKREVTAGTVKGSAASARSLDRDLHTPDGVASTDKKRTGAARRVLGNVAGALGWAGGKLVWRRSTVAHLGDENAFVYDANQQKWVLGRGRARGGRGSGNSGVNSGQGNGGAEERGGRTEASGLRTHRSESITSEDMTVLAIQVCERGLIDITSVFVLGCGYFRVPFV